MKILSLYIDNFGKLSDFRLELGDSLNCICAENGYGKTTLATFIKSMLYGMQKSTKRSPSENDRKHYYPWNGGAFGGTMDIETATGKYRIERSFGKKESDDTFALKDLSTGLESNAYTSNLGVELFGIDASSFEKSVFSPQGKDVDISMSSDIGAKLSNMLESSADMAESDRAAEQLEKYMKRFKLKKGVGGIIDELNASLASVLSEIEECRRAAASAESEKRYLEELRSRAEELRKKENELCERLELERKSAVRDVEYRRYLEYVEEAERLKEKTEELRAFFPEKLPDKEELDGIRAFCREIERKEKGTGFDLSPADSATYENYRARFGDTPLSDTELDGISTRLRNLKIAETEIYASRIPEEPEKADPPSRAGRNFLLAVFVICYAAAIGLGVASFVSFTLAFVIGGIACLILAIGLTVAFAAVSASIKKTELENEEKYSIEFEEYQNQYVTHDEKRISAENERHSLERLLGKYYPSCPGGVDTCFARLCTENERYRTLIESIRVLREKENAHRENIASLHREARSKFEGYELDVKAIGYDDAIQRIFEKMQELAMSASEYTETRRRAALYAKEKGIDPNAPPVSRDTRQTENELASLREKLHSISGEIGGSENRISAFEAISEKQFALLHKADAIRQEIALSESKYACAQKAKELIERARDGLSSRYLKSMESTFGENCDRFGTLLPQCEIDARLGVSFREDGASRDVEWYSEGMRAVIRLCMRLSLTDALFENEKPFMVLDDPFTDLDEKHLDAAKKIIRELSGNRQIIYLTCSNERRIENE